MPDATAAPPVLGLDKRPDGAQSRSRLESTRPGGTEQVQWRVLAWIGAALAVVGWLDWALIWFPLDFGNPQWEFGNISASIDALPLGTLGLGLIAASVVARGGRWTPRVLGVLFALGSLLLLGLLVIYLLDVPLALRSVQPQMRSVLRLAMMKTVVSALVYAVLYGGLAFLTLRRARRAA